MYTPCDSGECPFDAKYSEDCRVHCGLGVDESSPDKPELECPDAPDGQHDYCESRHNHERLYVCKYCGAALPDPPEDTPPPYDHP